MKEGRGKESGDDKSGKQVDCSGHMNFNDEAVTKEQRADERPVSEGCSHMNF